MELLLIRHGRPQTQQALDGNGADPPLTENGKAEADLLGHYLAAGVVPAPEVVFSSPMLRARETAEAIIARSGVPLHVEERLREFDHGAASYTPPELTVAPPEVKRAMWRVLETGVWGDHTFDPDAFEHRVLEVFEEIIVANTAAVVAVVCHAGVMNAFLNQVLARPRGMFFEPAYTSVSRVLVTRGGRRLVSLNETTHLQLAAVSRLGSDSAAR